MKKDGVFGAGAASSAVVKEFTGGTQALDFILLSLTKRHSELLEILAKDALKQYDHNNGNSNGNSNGSNSNNGGGMVGGGVGGVGAGAAGGVQLYRGMGQEELLLETSRRVIARSQPELRGLLMELTGTLQCVDRKIVS